MAFIPLATSTRAKSTRPRRLPNPLTRLKVRTAGTTYRERLRREMLIAYGSACSCCAIAITAFLTLQVDGAPPRENGQHQLVSLKHDGWPRRNARLMCWNCLLGSHRAGGACPHTKNRERLPSASVARPSAHADAHG